MKKLKTFMITALIVLFSSVLSGCAAKMPVPAVKEARFNFSVTYAIDGEETTYSDVYVCKYKRSYVSLTGGGVDWEGYLESTGGDPDIAIQTNEEGIIYIGLNFYPGYFMSDPDYVGYYEPFATLYMVYHDSNSEDWHIDSEEEVLEKHDVKILALTYDEPIENSFEEKFTFGRLDVNIN